MPELQFPPSLDNTGRKFAHTLCRKKGLSSKSYGTGEARFLVVRKKVSTRKRVPDLHLPRALADRIPQVERELAKFHLPAPVQHSFRCVFSEVN